MNVLFLSIFFQRDGSHAGNRYKRNKDGFGISDAKMLYGSTLQSADASLFSHCKLCAYFSDDLFSSSLLHVICQESYEKTVQKFKWSETKVGTGHS